MPVKNQAMPQPGSRIEDDAGGALQGGEAHRGDPKSAPRALGRKDPTVSASKTSEKPSRD